MHALTSQGQRVLTMAIFALGSSLSIPSTAYAHEPLWGETPVVFGSGLVHPEIRFGFMDAGSTQNGGVRARMFEQTYMVQYAPKPSMNLILEAPYHNNVRQQVVNGQLRSVPFVGLGDITLNAKSRLHARQAEGLTIQQTAIYGIKLPTGESHRLDPDGTRAAPHDQTGTSKPGLVLGYTADRETLKDTIWGSVEWRREFGSGFRMGDMAEVNVSYGRWLKQANEAAQLGVNLAVGLHGEWHIADTLDAGQDAHNGHHIIGLHITPIFTKGTRQLRIGLLVPLARQGPQDHVGYRYEIRTAFETFF
ncbi:MAG: hypothetical protein JO316_25310 [Abitibacteriaceae bacterium]|nr:hypothetical protein [Abditibacteriaceae bacterium]